MAEGTTAPKGPTYRDLAAPVDRRGGLRRLPRLIRDAMRLAWIASPRRFLIVIACELVSGVAVGAQLIVVKAMLETLITDGQPEISVLLPYLAAVVAVTVVVGLLGVFGQQQQQILGELVRLQTYARIIGVSSTVDLETFETPVFHDKLERASRAAGYRPVEMVDSLAMLSTGIATCGGIGIVLIALEPLLLVLICVAVVPFLAATLHNSRESYVFEYALTSNERERRYLMDLLTERSTAKELRTFGSTDHLRGRYEGLARERLAQLKIFLNRRLVVGFIGSLATAVGTAAALGALALLLSNGRIDASTAVTAAVAMWMLSGRLSMITGSFGKLVEAGMFLDDYRHFLALGEAGRDPIPLEPRGATPPPFGGLRVEDVRFRYPSGTHDVVENIDLEIQPGEIVALVGENGSGKTTLIKLICQLYRPAAGRILWGGRDASAVGAATVRDEMTVIFQDYIQYHLQARDNITLGRIDRADGDAAVEDAARRSGAHDFLTRLPEGYDTRLGVEFLGGSELSVGQWQRLALARAFFRGGDFLVLDEPTAALDPRAEAELFAQMRALAAGKAVLLVSHRFSTVRSADRIYVMQNGRITENGDHDTLMALGGHYAELFELQASAHLRAVER